MMMKRLVKLMFSYLLLLLLLLLLNLLVVVVVRDRSMMYLMIFSSKPLLITREPIYKQNSFKYVYNNQVMFLPLIL